MKDFIEHITKEAGALTRAYFGKVQNIQHKKDATDLVTEADFASHNYLVSAISQKFPNHKIISEEQENEELTDAPTWVIDPLDGTFHFATGTPMYVIMVCFIENKEVLFSCTYDPLQDEMFFAQKGKGAFLNGERIHCSSYDKINQGSGIIGWRMNPYYSSVLLSLYDIAKENKFHCAIISSAGYGAAQIAAGRRDWLLNLSCYLWDLAGISLLLSEAGCKVTNLSGKAWTVEDENLLCANETLHSELATFLKPREPHLFSL